MNIDLRTFALIIGITNFLQVIPIYLQYRVNKNLHGVGSWLAGFTMIAFGFSLFFLRDLIPVRLVSIILPNVLQMMGIVFIYVGIVRFLGKQENLNFIIVFFILFLFLFFYYTYGQDDINFRSVIMSAGVAFLYFLIAYSLIVNKTEAITASVNFNAALTLSYGVILMLRVAAIIIGSPISGLFSPTLMQTMFFMFVFIDGVLFTFGLVFMVSQHLNAETSEAEKHFEMIFNTTPDAILIAHLDDGRIVGANDGFTVLAVYTRAEVIGKSSLENNFWQDVADRQKIIDELKEKGFCKNLEFIFQHKNGSQLVGLVSARLITIQGQPHIVSVTRDITERKKAEEALRKSEQLYHLLADRVNDVIWTTTLDGRFTYVSPSVFQLRGFTPEEVLLQPLDEVICPSSIASVQTGFRRALMTTDDGQTQPIDYFEIEQPRKDGTTVWTEATARIMYDASGRSVGLVGVTRDITERRKAREALHESEEKWRSLVNASPDYIALHDREGRYLFINHYAEGFTEKDVIGQSLFEFLSPEFKEPYKKKLEECLDTLTTQKFEFSAMGDHGIYKMYEQYLVPIPNAKKEIDILAIARDITQRKQAEDEIRELNATLEKRVEERTDELRRAEEQLIRQEKLAVLGQMASSVGHELRNPLTVINSAIYYLKLIQPAADDKVKQYLGIIEQETHTSEKIITDLLDFARVKSVDREAVSVSELIRQTLGRFSVPPTVEVVFEISDNLPRVFVDPRQMTQVFGNLIVNACEAMSSTDPASGVLKGGKLSLYGNAQNDMINITVKDTGVGISQENIKKIFEPLFTTKTKGIGLGLAVSRKLVEVNDGSIKVWSEPGQGSSFSVYLPICKEL